MKSIKSKKARIKYLEDCLAITKEFLLGRNLTFHITHEESKLGTPVYFIVVEPSQCGVFGITEKGTFYSAVVNNAFINREEKELQPKEVIEAESPIWIERDSLEGFVELLCKKQVELLNKS